MAVMTFGLPVRSLREKAEHLQAGIRFCRFVILSPDFSLYPNPPELKTNRAWYASCSSRLPTIRDAASRVENLIWHLC